MAMYNSQLANWRTSPAGNEIERHTLGWLAAKFGLPARYHCDLYQRRLGSQSLRRGGGAESCVSGLRRTRSTQPVSASVSLSHGRGASRVQQDRAHDRDRPPCGSPGQDRPPAEARRGQPAPPGAPGPRRRLGAVSGRRHRGHHRGWGHRSAARYRPVLPRREFMVPRRCRVGRRGDPLACAQGASRRHRARRLDHLRRAQVAFRAHGLRHVLLPSPGERGPRVSRRRDLHVRQAIRAASSIHSPTRRSGRGGSSDSSCFWPWPTWANPDMRR